MVGSLLLLHGIHPMSAAERIELALEKVRPMLQSHQGNVELVSFQEATLKLRLQGTCNGCPSSQSTFKNLIESAVYDAAPEVERIEIEGIAL